MEPESHAPENPPLAQEDEPAGAGRDIPTPLEGYSAKKLVSEQFLRVNVEILDSLMNMVGELVLTRNQLLQIAQAEGERSRTGELAGRNHRYRYFQRGPARAEAGRFTQFEIQRGLPVQMLVRFFRREEKDWVIDPEIRKMITFKEFNLLEPFSSLGQFGLVFCRNVLIYFNADTKSQMLKEIADILIPQGYLFLGSAETILGISQVFERMGKEIAGYRRCISTLLASAS